MLDNGVERESSRMKTTSLFGIDHKSSWTVEEGTRVESVDMRKTGR